MDKITLNEETCNQIVSFSKLYDKCKNKEVIKKRKKDNYNRPLDVVYFELLNNEIMLKATDTQTLIYKSIKVEGLEVAKTSENRVVAPLNRIANAKKLSKLKSPVITIKEEEINILDFIEFGLDLPLEKGFFVDIGKDYVETSMTIESFEGLTFTNFLKGYNDIVFYRNDNGNGLLIKCHTKDFTLITILPEDREFN